MALLFSLRGNSLDARYATRDATHGSIATPPSLETTGWSGEIGASSIKMRSGSSSLQSSLSFAGRENTPACGFSILARVAFAANTGLYGLYCIAGGPHNGWNSIYLYYNAGTLIARWHDSTGTARINVNYVWTPTLNTFYDIFYKFDGTTAANAAKLYVDNVLGGQGTSAVIRPADDRKQTAFIDVGMAAFDVTASAMNVNEFSIWNTQENPSSILLTSGLAALNGVSRTAFVDAAAFDGATNVGAGAANIRSGSTETIAGVLVTGTAAIPTAANVRSGTATDATTGSLAVPSAANVRSGTAVDATTGTLVAPSLANTKTGVAGDGGTGTYDGSDRWTDPGDTNVRLATAYKANSTSNNKTGSAAIPAAANVRSGTAVDATTGTLVAPSLANTKTGVAGDGGTGTYDGSDRWTDPGDTNVRLATAYKANSTSNNKTGSLVVPSAGDVRDGIAVDAGLGTLVFPDVADIRDGVSGGTLEVPVEANVREGSVYDGGRIGTLTLIRELVTVQVVEDEVVTVTAEEI